jgi:hypothetical protein
MKVAYWNYSRSLMLTTAFAIISAERERVKPVLDALLKINGVTEV